MPLKGLVVRAQKTDGCPVHSGHRVDPVGCVGGRAHEVAAIRSGSNIWITASVWRWPPQVPLSRRQLPLSWSDKRVPSPLFPSLLLPPPPHSRLLRAQVLFFMFLVIFLSILDCWQFIFLCENLLIFPSQMPGDAVSSVCTGTALLWAR